MTAAGYRRLRHCAAPAPPLRLREEGGLLGKFAFEVIGVFVDGVAPFFQQRALSILGPQ